MKTKFIEKHFFKTIILLLIFIILSGCNNKNSQSTVSVIGIGTVMAEPDLAEMTISLTYVAPATRQAQEEVNKMAARLFEIFKKAGIEDKDIRTTSLSFRPEYQYSNNRQTLVGQRAEQSVIVKINEINTNKEKLPRLLDEITSVDKVILQQINFGIKDKSELFSQSRELAYQKAVDKANQYASLSGVKVVKALSISEFESNNFYSPIAQNKASFDYLSNSSAANLPTGELEITSQVSVVFLIK